LNSNGLKDELAVASFYAILLDGLIPTVGSQRLLQELLAEPYQGIERRVPVKSLRRSAKPELIYVDAKILNVHDQKLERVAYVGYFVERTKEHQEMSVSATESDDAEIQAILFAIGELGKKFEDLLIVCDHQSVVSEANREHVKKPSQLLAALRERLHANKQVKLEALQANLAHGTLTAYVNRMKQKTGAS
jgi:hypothetical protein